MTETEWAALWVFGSAAFALGASIALYKAIPSTADVSGPFKGLSIKLGGGIASFVVILLILLHHRPVEENHYHTWTVVGQLEARTASDEPDANLNDVFVRIVPPRFPVMNGGAIAWEIPVIESVDGRIHYPDLQLDLRGFRGQTISLSPERTYGTMAGGISYDVEKRLITMTKPISLQSLKVAPAYSPATAGAVARPSANPPAVPSNP